LELSYQASFNGRIIALFLMTKTKAWIYHVWPKSLGQSSFMFPLTSLSFCFLLGFSGFEMLCDLNTLRNAHIYSLYISCHYTYVCIIPVCGFILHVSFGLCLVEGEQRYLAHSISFQNDFSLICFL
jgi:hypothetical protein